MLRRKQQHFCKKINNLFSKEEKLPEALPQLER